MFSYVLQLNNSRFIYARKASSSAGSYDNDCRTQTGGLDSVEETMRNYHMIIEINEQT